MRTENVNLCQFCDYWKCEVCCNGDSPHCADYTGRLDGCQYGEPQKPLPAEITAQGVSRCPRCYAVLENADTTKPGGHIVCPDCGATVILCQRR